MKKKMLEVFDVTEDKHVLNKKVAPDKLSVVIGGGCRGWMVGTTAYWVSASGRQYMHSNVAWMSGDCANGSVYFFHIGGVPGGNYWHSCP